MVENINKTVGFNLKNLRKERKLSQKDISAVLGVSYQQVQKYESGFSMLPLEKLYRLRHYYGVPYERFFENSIGNSGIASSSSQKLTSSTW